jgi:hypothetical protein
VTDDATILGDRATRVRLWGASVCWLLLAVGYLGISSTARWYPDVAGAMSLIVMVSTITLVLRPTAVVAYRYGGTAAVGALTLVAVSLISGEYRVRNADLVWVAIGHIGITVLLAFLYARWWLTDVKDWHRAHRMIGH